MFNEVLKSGVSNILSLSEIEWKLEQTSLPQVGTAAWRCRKSPCAPRGDRLAVQGTKGCLGSLVRLRMLGYFCFFFPPKSQVEQTYRGIPCSRAFQRDGGGENQDCQKMNS